MEKQKQKEDAIFKNDSQERFDVWMGVKKKTGTGLSEAELDVIDQVYKDHQKETIVRVGIYRFINFILGAIALVIVSVYSSWINITVWAFFVFVQMFYGFKAVWDHRSFLERQKRLASKDE